jgi:hypothetical protein
MADHNLYDPTGTDFIVTALQAVRRREGVEGAMKAAREMIIAASSILAHEIGVEGALDVLARAYAHIDGAAVADLLAKARARFAIA